jgi:dipeptidyl-peptidase-4
MRHHGRVETYPRQKALTRNFRLGIPRTFRVAEDRVIFIRSAGPRVPAGDLWVMREADGWREVRLVDSAVLATKSQGVDPREAARRERLREVTTGITDFSSDTSARAVAFVLDGSLYRVDTTTGDIQHVPHEGSVIDPRMSPDGTWIAFVSGNALHLSNGACLSAPESDTVTYGLADFIAAEELDRHRGTWWFSDSTTLLVERSDEAPVPIRWIGDPAQPEREPIPHRYPQAGCANPQVSLHVVTLDGQRTEVPWDHDAFPYLASVHPTEKATAIVSLLSRDQRTQLVLSVDTQGRVVELARRMCTPWITVIPGVPREDPDGTLLEVLADTGAFRLCRDGTPLTPVNIQVDSLQCADDGGYVVGAQPTSTTRAVAHITPGGHLTWLTPTDGWCAAATSGGAALPRVTVCTTLGETRSQARLLVEGGGHPITSHAEPPRVAPGVQMHVPEDSRIRCAVLLPRDHIAGTRVPVICSPYGGPHAQRVVHNGAAFLTEQWLADQGFAVVVVDGRGTPGLGPEWEHAVAGDLASGVLADQVTGLESVLAAFPDLNGHRVGIRGWSFGGYLAALAVIDRPDIFHAAVAGAPVTDWRLYDTAYTERYLGLPQENEPAYDATSLLTRARNLTRPLLLIHGLADDNVLAAHTLRLSSALLAAGRQHSVLPLSGVTHMTPQEIVAENLLLTEVEFFRTHLAD